MVHGATRKRGARRVREGWLQACWEGGREGGREGREERREGKDSRRE
jgi:hypothetical protein